MGNIFILDGIGKYCKKINEKKAGKEETVKKSLLVSLTKRYTGGLSQALVWTPEVASWREMRICQARTVAQKGCLFD